MNSFSQSYSLEKKEFSADYDSGFKLNCTPFTFTAFYGKNDLRWALENRINQKYIFFDAKILSGNIKYSGAVSRLKSASPQSFSALKSPLLPSQGISSSLPSLNSSKSNFSSIILLSPGIKTKAFPLMQLAFVPEKEYFFNINKSFLLFSFANLSAGFTGGLFKHGLSVNKNWYFSNLPYKEDFYSAAELLVNFNSPYIKSSTGLSFFENPFSHARMTLNLTNSFIIEDFTLNTLLFFSDQDLITAKGSRPENKFEWKINPQCKFYFNKSYLNAGLCIEKKESESSFLKIKSALLYNLKKTNTALYFNKSIYQNKSSSSYKISFSAPVFDVKNSFSLLYKNSSSKESFSFTHSISTVNFPLTSAGISFSSDINPFLNQKFKSYMQFSFLFNRIKINANASFLISGNFL